MDTFTDSTITLQSDALRVSVGIDRDGTVALQEVNTPENSPKQSASRFFPNSSAPLVEIRLAGEGTAKHKSSKTLLGGYLGTRLKYKAHKIQETPHTKTLDVTLVDNSESPITVVSHLTVYHATPVLRATVTVQNDGDRDIVVTQVSSLVLGGLTVGSKQWWSDYILSVPNNSWFREAQWIEHSLPSLGIDDYGVYGHPEDHWGSLAHYAVSNRGSFSTEGHLPMGMLKHRDDTEIWLWQVENNGSWRWEIGDWKDSVYLAAGGPIETDHDWRERLSPGQTFTTVPVAVTHVMASYDAAFAAMTLYRRQMRRSHSDHERLPIIFNDYMNCLMGDPTDQKILALVEPVLQMGAEYFVIDAGWYADDSGWWDDVGLWEPSKKRFPMGFDQLLSHLKAKRLIPGLWIEPEVIGVRSVVAKELPEEAFFQRDGQRVVEKGRYQLDFRHTAVRDRMHSIINRLVTGYGVGYFKFDYNIEVTQGTDINCSSPGAGQLEHNRAYLAWIVELHQRYPDLVIENCSSGAQRMDYAMLSVHALQSTSDQQDPIRYAAIAAALPTAVTPEQGATWAYPQPEWDDETNAMTVLNSLLGRIHLSGRLDLLQPHQFDLIRHGMDVYRSLRLDLPRAVAFWPLGLPRWHDDWLALGQAVPGDGLYYLAVWRRGGPESTELPIADLHDRSVQRQLLFPNGFPAEISWNASKSTLTVRLPSSPSSRLFKVVVAGQ